MFRGVVAANNVGLPDVQVRVIDLENQLGTTVLNTTTNADGLYVIDSNDCPDFNSLYQIEMDFSGLGLVNPQFCIDITEEVKFQFFPGNETLLSEPFDAIEIICDELQDADVQVTIFNWEVHGLYFIDTNKDDLLLPEAVPNSNKEVQLLEASSSSVLATTTTDEFGKYSFSGLSETGSLKVKFIKEDGQDFVTANQGNDAVDSDVINDFGESAPFTVGCGVDPSISIRIDGGLVETEESVSFLDVLTFPFRFLWDILLTLFGLVF